MMTLNWRLLFCEDDNIIKLVRISYLYCMKFLIVIAVGLLLFSCSKEENKNEKIYEVPCQENSNINYKELTPQIIINSVRYTLPCSGHTCLVPNDTSIIVTIDVNNDSIDDIIIDYKNIYNFVSPSSPWANYSRFVKLSGSHSNIKLSSSNDNQKALMFPINQIINEGLYWEQSVNIVFNHGLNPNPPSNIEFIGTQYVGFRLTNGQESNYGWLLLERPDIYSLRVISYARNLTPNNCIRTGQTN